MDTNKVKGGELGKKVVRFWDCLLDRGMFKAVYRSTFRVGAQVRRFGAQLSGLVLKLEGQSLNFISAHCSNFINPSSTTILMKTPHTPFISINKKSLSDFPRTGNRHNQNTLISRTHQTLLPALTQTPKQESTSTNRKRCIRELIKHVLRHQIKILWTLGQTAHKVSIPILTKWYICTEVISLIR